MHDATHHLATKIPYAPLPNLFLFYHPIFSLSTKNFYCVFSAKKKIRKNQADFLKEILNLCEKLRKIVIKNYNVRKEAELLNYVKSNYEEE